MVMKFYIASVLLVRMHESCLYKCNTFTKFILWTLTWCVFVDKMLLTQVIHIFGGIWQHFLIWWYFIWKISDVTKLKCLWSRKFADRLVIFTTLHKPLFNSIQFNLFCSRNPYFAIQPPNIEQVNNYILI
jgi:hypothetical protein